MTPTDLLDRPSSGADAPRIGVRELKQNASKVIADLQADRETRVITVNGRPAAALVPYESIAEAMTMQTIARLGIPARAFRAGLERIPTSDMTAVEIVDWLDDIAGADTDTDPVDPFERAGL